MKKQWKKEGTISFIPVLFLFIILVVIIILLLMNKSKVIQIYDRLYDGMSVSSQAICVSDRYVPGAFHWNRKDVVYDSGTRENAQYYVTNPAVATKAAAELSYDRFIQLLDYNLPEEVVQYKITEYVLVNVISGTAYCYDYLHLRCWEESTMLTESYLEFTIDVQLELPLFGTANWVKEALVVLVEE